MLKLAIKFGYIKYLSYLYIMKIPKILFKFKIPQSGIYCIENIKNGKIYIGSSKNMYQRLHVHRVYLNKNVHDNAKLQNSWNKHKEESFICYSLEHCNENELTQREQFYIDLYNPWYNITKEVIRNTPSLESRKKISETLKKGYREGTIKLTRCRPVKAYKINGEYIETYATIKDCAKALNINHTSIQRVLIGMYKQCKGYQFKYLEDNTKPNIIKVNLNGKALRKPAPVKQGELLENPTSLEDNQQPSLISNDFEGSTTNSRILNKDSNANTSALPKISKNDLEAYIKLQDDFERKLFFGDDIV